MLALEALFNLFVPLLQIRRYASLLLECGLQLEQAAIQLSRELRLLLLLRDLKL